MASNARDSLERKAKEILVAIGVDEAQRLAPLPRRAHAAPVVFWDERMEVAVLV